jgi:uncharacterized membrane protein YkvA (DUF1232 family)
MGRDKVRRKIEAALADEEQSHRLEEATRALIAQTGRRPAPKEVAKVVAFVRDYVAHVPLVMEAGLDAARKAGIGAEMQRVVGAIRQYWSEPNDLIPDRLGLIGIVDDAYYALCIVQGVADRFRQQTGQALLPQDFTAASLAMRSLIGEPVATALDTYVSAALLRPDMVASILGMVNAGMPVTYQDPIWGNASIEERVRVQMGALGIV